jgi:hypothetical protein
MRTAIAILGLVMVSCSSGDSKMQNENPVVKEDSAQVNSTGKINIAGCYIKILKRDTMVLHLQQTGTNVSGKMNFDNYEKDGSVGEVKGVIEKNTVKMWYSFQSEGMNSVMELYFMIEDSSVIQGVGPVITKGDTAYFADHSAINFSKDQAFTKTDCSFIPAKYL